MINMPGDAIGKLTDDVREIFEKNKVTVKFRTDKKGLKTKYGRQKSMTRGYDLLEYTIVVRPYILKRYKIDNQTLEILMYLSPKRFFTQRDYSAIPKSKYCRFPAFVKLGFVDLVMSGENIGRKVYCINRKGTEIVQHYYECLSGEKQIPINSSNPMTRTDAAKKSKRELDLIRRLRDLPVLDTKRQHFE